MCAPNSGGETVERHGVTSVKEYYVKHIFIEYLHSPYCTERSKLPTCYSSYPENIKTKIVNCTFRSRKSVDANITISLQVLLFYDSYYYSIIRIIRVHWTQLMVVANVFGSTVKNHTTENPLVCNYIYVLCRYSFFFLMKFRCQKTNSENLFFLKILFCGKFENEYHFYSGLNSAFKISLELVRKEYFLYVDIKVCNGR